MQARIDYPACPLCGHEEGDQLGTADVTQHPLFRPELPPTLRWLRCGRCEHVFASGYFTPEAFAVLFSGANDSQVLDLAKLDQQRQASARIVERVVNARKGELGRWLDVGFGSGALLTTAAEFGFTAVGVDVRAEAVARLQAAGLEAHQSSLEAFTASEPFEVVSLCDVLEHVPWPRQALEHATTLLAPGGVLFVSTPNRDAFQFQALTRAGKNPYWAELEHLHVFGRRALCAQLEALGYRELRYSVSERYLAGMELLGRRG